VALTLVVLFAPAVAENAVKPMVGVPVGLLKLAVNGPVVTGPVSPPDAAVLPPEEHELMTTASSRLESNKPMFEFMI
jgi:hypothetical protein